MRLSAEDAGCRKTPLKGTIRRCVTSNSSKLPVNVPKEALIVVFHLVILGGAVWGSKTLTTFFALRATLEGRFRSDRLSVLLCSTRKVPVVSPSRTAKVFDPAGFSQGSIVIIVVTGPNDVL